MWTEISVLLLISYIWDKFEMLFFLFKFFLEIILFIISSSFPQSTIHNYANIGIGSVSADMKKRISVIYRIGQFGEWHLSVFIGIGRYEKKLIGRTLTLISFIKNCPPLSIFQNITPIRVRPIRFFSYRPIPICTDKCHFFNRLIR